MKKNIFRLFAIMILSTTLSLFYSCSTPFKVINEKKSIGKNQITNADVQADLFFFEDRIDNFYVDTTSNFITIQIRGLNRNSYLNNSGKIYIYDLTNKSILWNKSNNYISSSTWQKDSIIIQNNSMKSYKLNKANGKKLWSESTDIWYVDFNKMIGFGYKSLAETRETLKGVDLNTGKPVWKRELRAQIGWDGIFQLNDSIVIVAADGLHSINLKNGNGWDYWAITGKKESLDHTAANIGGVALGLLTGMYVISYGGYNLTHGISSNVIIDSTSIYWASKESIVKFNHSGEILWQYGLPQDMVSKSNIFLQDSLVWMVNLGYAYFNNNEIKYGKPYVAAFNQKSGHKVFIKNMKDENNVIIDYEVKQKEVKLMSSVRLSKFSALDGSLLIEKRMGTDSLGYLKMFVTNDLYTKQDTMVKTLKDIDSTNDYILTNKIKLVALNDKLEVVKQLDNLTPYIAYLEKDGYKFIGSSDESFILDKNGRVVANLKVSKNAIVIGTKLYDCMENAMIIVDLQDILKNQ